MKIITAIGNEEINKKIKEKNLAEVIGTDIQYQEAVIEIIEKNEDINLLILSSILPGERNIREFINIIKYKNEKLEIIIILEKEDKDLKEFIISKGINKIYYNNKITFNEMLEEIKIINNKTIKNSEKKTIINKYNKLNKNNYLKIIKTNKLNKINYLKKIKINKLNYLKNKKIIKLKIINYLKNKKIKNKLNKIINYNKLNKIDGAKKQKIITIIGASNVGKSVFSLILSLNIKNKKILIIDFNTEKKDLKIITGKKEKQNEELIKWKKNINILNISTEKYLINNNFNKKNIEEIFNNNLKYDYIIIDIGNIEKTEQIIKKTDKIIMLVEANLLGINESKKILEKIVYKYRIQKKHINIIYNKQTSTSISVEILNTMFSDFKIIGIINYDKNYNLFLNSNGKYMTKKIKNKYIKIINKII